MTQPDDDYTPTLDDRITYLEAMEESADPTTCTVATAALALLEELITVEQTLEALLLEEEPQPSTRTDG